MNAFDVFIKEHHLYEALGRQMSDLIQDYEGNPGKFALAVHRLYSRWIAMASAEFAKKYKEFKIEDRSVSTSFHTQ